jgi:ATP diphosphatase
VPAGLPSFRRAQRLQEKASTVGFDWNDARLVIAKLREEVSEIDAELDRAAPDRLEDEVGDLLFAVVNLARHLKVDPDQALRRGNAKFARRFAAIEAALAADGRTPADSDLAEMERLWQEAKAGGQG